jgi:26S proteasome regulatory subunit N5
MDEFSGLCDEVIANAYQAADTGNFHQALEGLYALEKQTRQSADAVTTARLLVTIVRICFQVKKYTELNKNITVYTKKKSQSKEAVKAMIVECYEFVSKMDDKEAKIRLIETLRDASEGKIYLEVERARLTKMLAAIRESDRDVEGAVTLMEKLQLDCYGSMEKEEKVEFIIAQMRLLIQTTQLSKAQIISKRINPTFFKDAEHRDLKHQFYNLMIEIDKEERFLNTAAHYLAMYEPTLSTESNLQILQSAVIYCILSSHSAGQKQMLQNLSTLLQNNQHELYKNLIDLFLNNELIDWSGLQCTYKAGLTALPFLSTATTYGIRCWKELRTRTIEHNIRMFSLYYVRVRLSRMSEMLVLNESETEKFICRLISDGVLRAKIDRPAGIVYFNAALQSPNEKLNTWATELVKLMALISKANHLIAATNMENAVTVN